MLLVIAPGSALLGRCRMAGEFLACRHARRTPDDPAIRVLGVWLDAAGVDVAPLGLPDPPGNPPRTVRLRESVGINGLWSLQSLESTLATARDARHARESLVRSLACGSRSPKGRPSPQFAPVFDPTLDAREDMWREWERLRRLFPQFVTEPIAWTVETGEIGSPVPPSEAGRATWDATPGNRTARPRGRDVHSGGSGVASSKLANSPITVSARSGP